MDFPPPPTEWGEFPPPPDLEEPIPPPPPDWGDGDPDSDSAEADRRTAWVKNRNTKIAVARQKRTTRLEQDRVGIERAVAAYKDLDTGEATPIRIRKSFIRLPESRDIDTSRPYAERRADDLTTRPLLTRLVNRKSNGLRVYLSAIYVAHLENPSGAAVANERHSSYGSTSWTTLTGLDGEDRPRRRRVPGGAGQQARGSRNSPRENTVRNLNRALAELEGHRLIEAGPRKAGRFKGWTLNQEDGLRRPYEVPSQSTDSKQCVAVPYWFFRNGWHLVLEPPEIATLFAIIERTQTLPGFERKHGVALPTSERRNRFGLTDEVYESIHELGDLKLIDTVMPTTPQDFENGELEPSRFFWPPRDAGHTFIESRPAIEVVLEDLKIALPERLYPDLIGPRTVRDWPGAAPTTNAFSP